MSEYKDQAAYLTDCIFRRITNCILAAWKMTLLVSLVAVIVGLITLLYLEGQSAAGVPAAVPSSVYRLVQANVIIPTRPGRRMFIFERNGKTEMIDWHQVHIEDMPGCIGTEWYLKAANGDFQRLSVSLTNLPPEQAAANHVRLYRPIQ